MRRILFNVFSHAVALVVWGECERARLACLRSGAMHFTSPNLSQLRTHLRARSELFSATK
jgi:hypothetical protein